MASTYPTSLDVFTNPLTTNPLTAPSHAQQHSDINDAVEALEAKVAIGATVLGTYTAFTPTWFGLTVGNGSVDAAYCQVNKWVHYYGFIGLGSTSVVTGNIVITLPVNCTGVFQTYQISEGPVSYHDISAGSIFVGSAQGNLNNNTVAFNIANVAGTYPRVVLANATVPFTWTPTDADRIHWNLYYRAA